MCREFRVFLAMCFVFAQIASPIAGQVATQASAEDVTLALAGATAAVGGDVASEKVVATKSLTKDNAVYLVRLQNNGTLAGRLRIQYPTGKADPADAKVVFARAGKKVDWTKTDEEGHFEMLGVAEGTYMAKATIAAGETEFNVRVLPYDAAAEANQMLLDATLTPTPEVIYDAGFVDSATLDCGGCGNCEMCGMVVEEYIEPVAEVPCDMGCQVAAPCGGGFSGGGCCGGGGGWGGRGLGLLAAGGLATGITALALRDPKPASPAAP